MNLKKSFSLALSNIMYDKMRSFLTMLGIIVGVAAVIILISLMNGLTGMITDMFTEMGTTTITANVTARGGSRVINEEDVYAIRDEHPELIAGVSPTVSLSNATIKVAGNGDNITSTATGVSEEYADMKQLNITDGRFLNYVDITSYNKFCVIGTYIQKELFNGSSALGQTIKINSVPYTVIGILEEKDESQSGGSDDVIYVPYTTAFRQSSNSSISSYTLTATSDTVSKQAKEVIERKFFDILGDDDYFTVVSMQELIDKLTEILDTVKIMLVCIAGISLLVGGIGIMNIMLVSVTERTREIGIRKSLGAKGSAIMSQFVIEAATVSGVGGVIGIVLGSIFAVVVGKLMGLTATPSIIGIIIAFSVSVGIGIIFGYLPAKNAAKLNPIDALRYD